MEKQSEFTFILASHIYSIIQASKADKKYDLRVLDAKQAIEEERPVFTADREFISKRLDEVLRLVKIGVTYEHELIKFLDYHADIDAI